MHRSIGAAGCLALTLFETRRPLNGEKWQAKALAYVVKLTLMGRRMRRSY